MTGDAEVEGVTTGKEGDGLLTSWDGKDLTKGGEKGGDKLTTGGEGKAVTDDVCRD